MMKNFEQKFDLVHFKDNYFSLIMICGRHRLISFLLKSLQSNKDNKKTTFISLKLSFIGGITELFKPGFSKTLVLV